MHNDLLNEIRKADTITIHRHIHPDMDAIGCQMGLKFALKTLFPDKDIRVIGHMTNYGFEMDEPADQADLAILLDTATAERIDGDEWKDAKHSIRIDHHVKVEDLAEKEWVDTSASATGELIARLFEENGLDIGKDAAQMLYQALTSDNIRYTTSNTTPQSLRTGAWLLEQGADLAQSEKANFATSWLDFDYEEKVRSKKNRINNFVYAVMEEDDYLNCGLNFSRAKEKVFVFGGIEGIEVWALFTRSEDAIHYNASLRSRTISVRTIAADFGGGGHENASGIKGLTSAQVIQVIERCAAASRQ